MRCDVMATYVAPFHALGVRFPAPPYNHFAPKKMIFEFGKAERRLAVGQTTNIFEEENI